MKPLSQINKCNSVGVRIWRPPIAALVLAAALVGFSANGAETPVPSSVAQEDRAFLESVATGGNGSHAEVTTVPSATVQRETPPANDVREERPAVTHSKRPPRPIAEQAAAVPTPDPIASRTVKPKKVQREAPVASTRETNSARDTASTRETAATRETASVRDAEPRRPIASSRVSSRKMDTPSIKPFYQDDEELAPARASGGTRTVDRTRTTVPSTGRVVEVRRAVPVEHDVAPEPPSRREGFFHRLFHDDDHDDD
jgi:hypothetical protein